MVDQPRRRPYQPDIDSLERDINTLNDSGRPRPYAFGRTAQNHNEYQSGESVPLFLSDPDEERSLTELEYEYGLRTPRRFSISAKILMSTIAASMVAVAFAWFSSDATRDMLLGARASIATVLPVPSAAAQPEGVPTQLTARDLQLKDPALPPASANPDAGRTPQQQIAMLPSREEISTAYQAAVQNRAPAPPAAAPAPAAAAPPPAAVAPAAMAPAAIAPVGVAPVAVAPPAAAPTAPPARRMDRQELANLMQRAKGFLATGDLAPARLLLERAAESQEADAALMLAQTYDPEVLGSQDIRNIVPEPAKARVWYQKAAQLGSADAQRRLAQLAN